MKRILTTALLTFFLQAGAQTNYKNLVFEGGGIRGIAYAGAIKTLEDEQILSSVERTAGTSSGSIAALMVSLGFNSIEIDSMLRSLPFEQFNDGGGFFIGGIRRLKKSYGWYKGERMEKWIGEMIQTKTGNPDLTFAQLHQLASSNKLFKDIFVTATNITAQRVEIFSHLHSPGFAVKTAVRISCSIPLYFQPVCIDSNGCAIKKRKKGANHPVYVDGGMLANFPISMFDTCKHNHNPLMCDELLYNSQTLGLKLERPEQIEQQKTSPEPAPYNTSSLNNYLNAFMSLMIESANRRNSAAEKGRTVYISTGNISPKVRKMKAAEKELLFENGRTAVAAFLRPH
jgi:NTE family protein